MFPQYKWNCSSLNSIFLGWGRSQLFFILSILNKLKEGSTLFPYSFHLASLSAVLDIYIELSKLETFSDID